MRSVPWRKPRQSEFRRTYSLHWSWLQQDAQQFQTSLQILIVNGRNSCGKDHLKLSGQVLELVNSEVLFLAVGRGRFDRLDEPSMQIGYASPCSPACPDKAVRSPSPAIVPSISSGPGLSSAVSPSLMDRLLPALVLLGLAVSASGSLPSLSSEACGHSWQCSFHLRRRSASFFLFDAMWYLLDLVKRLRLRRWFPPPACCCLLEARERP